MHPLLNSHSTLASHCRYLDLDKHQSLLTTPDSPLKASLCQDFQGQQWIIVPPLRCLPALASPCHLLFGGLFICLVTCQPVGQKPLYHVVN
jgi:hypothetical protein